MSVILLNLKNIGKSLFKSVLYNAVKKPVSSVKKFFNQWFVRFTVWEETRNYCASEFTKFLFILFYILINLGFVVGQIIFIAYVVGLNLTARNPQYAWWLLVAKIGGMLLNVNCALILLPIVRSFINLLITLKFNNFIPLEKNILFHRYCAYMIALSTFIHGFGHYMNFSCCSGVYEPYASLKQSTNAGYSAWVAAWGNKYSVTGHLICLIMIVMYCAAHSSYRRGSNFTVFYYTHHLFSFFYILLLVHGRNFWMFFLGPGFLYLIERILRIIRGSAQTIVKRVHALPSNVIYLELEKPGFYYKAGQYCFLNCPLISKYEWHPFTISSCPQQEYMSFHIRCVGDWTNALMDVFNPSRKETVVIDRPVAPDGMTTLLRIDGPFGTSADYVFSYKYCMLIATGIGVTPYASLLKEIQWRLHNEKHKLRLQKVWFFWMNRDEGSWEWFVTFLNDMESSDGDFFEINTFMTGSIEVEQMKKIYFSSTEYTNSGGVDRTEVVGRCLSDYEAQGTDEIDLSQNDMIAITERDGSGWWKGTNQTSGETGLFPSNHVCIVDMITGMKESKNRFYGRPVWSDQFGNVRKQVETFEQDSKKRPTVGVFFCGPSALGKEIKDYATKENKKGRAYFSVHKENF